MKKTVDKIIIINNINLEEVRDELADFICKYNGKEYDIPC